MDFSDKDKDSTSRVIGFAVIVGLHVLVGYAVVSGLGTKLVDVIKRPVETKIIEEVKPPPPKDLPPPPPPPEVKAPPPPFIPPPEVVVNSPPPPNTISQTTNVKPESNVLPKPQPSAPPAEAPKPAAPPAPVRAYVNVKECEIPEYPAKALRESKEGTVVISFLVGADGSVKDSKIDKSSGSRDLDRAAKDKLSECRKFKAGIVNGSPVESWATVEYVWKID